jgi:hypothetical protein
MRPLKYVRVVCPNTYLKERVRRRLFEERGSLDAWEAPKSVDQQAPLVKHPEGKHFRMRMKLETRF